MIRRPPRSTRTDTLFPTRRSSDLILITQDSSVGIYFAEVVQARTQGTTTPLYDLSSVQVLKGPQGTLRSEEHTSELQSLMRISYAVFCLKKKNIYNSTEQSRNKNANNNNKINTNRSHVKIN